jgi:hypothetical protein
MDNEFKDFYEEFKQQNKYYPLTKKVLSNIYAQCKGNPRDIIKTLIKVFNRIIYSSEDLEDLDAIVADYETSIELVQL